MIRPESCHDCDYFEPYSQFDAWDWGQNCGKVKRPVTNADAEITPIWCPLDKKET